MIDPNEAPTPRRALPLVEAAAATLLLALLALITVPDLLGATERGRHEACLHAIHAVDDELRARMKAFTDSGHVAPADAAIEATLERLRSTDARVNPRAVDDIGYVRGLDPELVPPPGSSCRVYLIDDTIATARLTPAIVVTAFERGVHSHRLVVR